VEQDGRSSAFGEATESSVDPVAWDQRVEPIPPIAGESIAATIAALADPATRSPQPDTCPFLRTIDATGAPTPPYEQPDPVNRCVAVGEPTPQSGRQQELVCLTTGHNNCPRYLRGALVAADTLRPVERHGPSTPVIASALLLIAAASMSIGFLLIRGGFDLPAVSAAASQVAVAPSGGTPMPSSSQVVLPLPSVSVSLSPSPSPAVVVPPSATPAPPSSTPTPSPAPTPTPASTSDRYLLLVPCPGATDCWIYTVRSGDNLVSIANYFGVDYDTVLRMNPAIGDPTEIRAGDEIRMPPPTR
jgi:LysM domain